MAHDPMAQHEELELERRTLAKVAQRLLPFMFLLYVFNILDRVNVNIAILTMKADLGMTDTAYAFGAGVFFWGYFFFEVPSNIMLERLGARIWMARIMITWGLVASAMMFIRDAASFAGMRILLGVAEAGFFPGMMLYLSYWFPNVVRSRAAARFVIANIFANIIGGPLGAQFLKMEGTAGLHGWQWLFLLEGIPTVILGCIIPFYMTDRPEHARWLQDEEREWLVRRMAHEQSHRQKYHHMTLLEAFRYPRVLHLAVLFFLNICAGAGVGLFANPILKARSGWNDETVLWVNAIPSILSAVALLIAAHYSDRTRERRLFVAGGLALSSVGIFCSALTGNPWLTLAAFSLNGMGGAIQNGPFWALTTGFLSGSAAAGGIAFINSIGNLGSFFGQFATGLLKDRLQGRAEPALIMLSMVMLMASYVAYRLPKDPATEAEHPADEVS